MSDRTNHLRSVTGERRWQEVVELKLGLYAVLWKNESEKQDLVHAQVRFAACRIATCVRESCVQ
jgi:hypothetical protein